MDDLVARIDTPRLNSLSITFFYQTNFDAPHLVEFIGRTERFEGPCKADFRFDFGTAEVGLSLPSDFYPRLRVEISYDEEAELELLDERFSTITQVCAKCLPSFPTVENLRVFTSCSELEEEDTYDVEIETNRWLGFLRPFTAVKSLYLSKEFQPTIASTLQELVGRRTTEVLPSLQNIFLEDPSGHFQDAIRHFVAARQLSGRPIAILQDRLQGILVVR
jgi:hypothetical protein